ncbi:MAG: hypothetical protein JWN07_262 [Hyphomicrobiales bacterium]|nr:hypothetical protein [Hyphomicrobiales bacterium]
MTPMREAFVTVLDLIEQQTRDRASINDWLMLLMERARDAEEAGAAANFAAAALLFLDACEKRDDAQIAELHDRFELNTHILTSVMLVRRGRFKVARESLCHALV